MPKSFAVRTADGTMEKDVTPGAEGTSTYTILIHLIFNYDYYPQEMILYVTSTYQEKQPFISAGMADARWKNDQDRQIWH